MLWIKIVDSIMILLLKEDPIVIINGYKEVLYKSNVKQF